MFDVIHYSPKYTNGFIRNLQSPHSQSMFFNIAEKKNHWFLQAKVNPAIFTGKVAKNEKAGPMNWSRAKMDAVQEVLKYIKRYVYYDALKIQTIEVSRLLRQLIKKTGLVDKEVFRLTEISIEEKSEIHMAETSVLTWKRST